MKKSAAVLLALGMAVMGLAGCSGKSNSTATTAATEAATTAETTTAAAETTTEAAKDSTLEGPITVISVRTVLVLEAHLSSCLALK